MSGHFYQSGVGCQPAPKFILRKDSFLPENHARAGATFYCRVPKVSCLQLVRLENCSRKKKTVDVKMMEGFLNLSTRKANSGTKEDRLTLDLASPCNAAQCGCHKIP
jgi:hypothetical protein